MFKILNSQGDFEAIASNFQASTVHAGGLAPIGARPPACTVMNKFRAWIYKGPILKGLKIDPLNQEDRSICGSGIISYPHANISFWRLCWIIDSKCIHIHNLINKDDVTSTGLPYSLHSKFPRQFTIHNHLLIGSRQERPRRDNLSAWECSCYFLTVNS